MNYKRMKLRTCTIIAGTMMSIMAFAANKQTKLYMYGFVTSFNDSTVYFTEIQETDSAWVDKKTGFLYSRNNYSYQLRNHMKKNGIEFPTCITVYAKKRKDIEKKYTTLKKRYSGKNTYTVKYISANEFQFRPITPDESEMEAAESKKK